MPDGSRQVVGVWDPVTGDHRRCQDIRRVWMAVRNDARKRGRGVLPETLQCVVCRQVVPYVETHLHGWDWPYAICKGCVNGWIEEGRRERSA
jgi:hypothetical protein